MLKNCAIITNKYNSLYSLHYEHFKRDRHVDVCEMFSRAVKMAEKLNSNFVPKYYQNSNYIRI